MSGICGLLNLDGAPVTETALGSMAAMLEQRAPEGTHLWRGASIGLGHTLLATTPELQFERQPFCHSETGCVIIADVRLDNRGDLLHTFGLYQRRAAVGDAELILRAYLEWDERCPEELLGDFAFAIWDPRQKKLFCARDHFGLRPLYYHHAAAQRFAFGSSPQAILVLPQVPYRTNEGRIADSLVRELEWIDYTSTFFDDVFRLPPAHKAIVTSKGVEISEYWKSEPGPELQPMSDEDYAQGFVEVFTRAVEARLRAPAGTVGATLSGGMDSGSVVAVAKDILADNNQEPLPTFSAARPQGVNCAESRVIYASASMPSIAPNFVLLETLNDSDGSLTSGYEEPFDGDFVFLKAIYAAACHHGQSVVLDGVGGDMVLGHGAYITQLLRQGKARRALAEIVGETRFWNSLSLPAELWRYAAAAFAPAPLKDLVRPARYRRQVAGHIKDSLISPDLADRVRIRERFETMRQTFAPSPLPTFEFERSNSIRPNLTAGRERYARIAATKAVEARDPFLDKRVVDYCTRLPGHLLVKDGWPKALLRDVMAGRLPDEVRWARGKPHLGYQFNERATKMAVERGEVSLAGLQSDLQGYVDPMALEADWQEFRSGGDASRIHSVCILAKWLKETANRPVVPSRRIR